MGMPSVTLMGSSTEVVRFQMLRVPLLEAVTKMEGWTGLISMVGGAVDGYRILHTPIQYKRYKNEKVI